MSLSNEALLNLLDQNILYEVVTGSKGNGLDTKDSDTDIKCIAELPPPHMFTLGEPYETLTVHEPNDREYHSLRKMINLLNKQNPTTTEMLWAEERFVLKTSKYGTLLRENRDLFLSQNVYDSFSGYAKQQLMRIKAGLDKLTEADKIEHLSYTATQVIHRFPKTYSEATPSGITLKDTFMQENGKENLTLSVHYDNVSLSQINSMMSELFHTVKAYNKMGKRNKKAGTKLTKHAMTLLRLQKSGAELLETGKLTVFREKDRDFFLGVRHGDYTWDEIFDMVRDGQTRLDKALKGTSLPEKTNGKQIEELYQDMMVDWFSSKM